MTVLISTPRTHSKLSSQTSSGCIQNLGCHQQCHVHIFHWEDRDTEMEWTESSIIQALFACKMSLCLTIVSKLAMWMPCLNFSATVLKKKGFCSDDWRCRPVIGELARYRKSDKESMWFMYWKCLKLDKLQRRGVLSENRKTLETLSAPRLLVKETQYFTVFISGQEFSTSILQDFSQLNCCMHSGQ